MAGPGAGTYDECGLSLGVSAKRRAENRPWDLIRFIPAWGSEKMMCWQFEANAIRLNNGPGDLRLWGFLRAWL